MDALSDVLRHVRMTGAVFFNAELTAPWALDSPPAPVLARGLGLRPDYLMEYHLLLEGGCYIRVAGGAPLELRAGDLVMMLRGDPHVMSDRPDGRPAPNLAAAIRMPKPGEVACERWGGGGALTRLACGYLTLDRALSAALIGALPQVLHVKSLANEVGGWIETYVRLSVHERSDERPGGASVLGKLSELMFVEGVRRYVESLPPEQTGWLAGLRDPQIGRVLGLIHAHPNRPWTVEGLGRAVGMSRSALAARFTALIGQSPMQYLTRWRLTLAAHMLRTTAKAAAVVAEDIGYDSEAAFSRAFRREFGAPPAIWRRGERPAPTRSPRRPPQTSSAGRSEPSAFGRSRPD
jgi:AraC family transcriptional regulator, alkane utilization regulator